MGPQSANPGQHELRIESINGTILGAQQSGKGVTLAYESHGRCYVTLNRAPAKVLCDGAPDKGEVLSIGERVCLVLPQGNHTVELE